MSIAISPQQIENSPEFEPVGGLGLRAFLSPLFWVSFATIGSAYKSLRFEVAGMAFHPYMLALVPLVFRALPRLPRFPARIGRPGALFLLLYIVSLIQGNSFLIQLVKISVMMITFVLIALSVRSMDDFLAGAMGLGMGALVLCIRGFIRGPGAFGSINPIEGSQKNAFSLFYLPALTICLYLLFSPLLRLNRKMVFALVITVIFAGIALSRNRSGWLATGVIIFMLFGTHRHRLRIVIFLGLAACMAFVVSRVILSEEEFVYERDEGRTEQSDMLRLHLLERALIIGFQHPLVGVSPTELSFMLGDLYKAGDQGIDCHNLTGYLVGGSGVITFAAFCLFIYAMLRPPPSKRHHPDVLIRESVRLLSTYVVIWMVRAQFQEDALFSPTFACGLGLCVGLCIFSGVYSSKSGTAHDQAVDQDYVEDNQLEVESLSGSSLDSNGPRHLLGRE